MLIDLIDKYVSNYKPYKGGAWCYEDGCIYRGLEMLHQSTGEDRWLDHITRMIDKQISEDGTLLRYKPEEFNIDNIQPGRVLFHLHQETGKDRYLKAADNLAKQLEGQPRTQSNVYWHKLRYPSQVWLDGLYMAAPFQIHYGIATQNNELIDDSIRQISMALDITFKPETGLYVHAIDETKDCKWSNPTNGQSAAHWARALGWLCMALVDVRELVGAEKFEPLEKQSRELLNKILNLQYKTGLWLQVIDQPELKGNYAETSASAMFTYALLKAKHLGLTDTIPENLFESMSEYAITNSESENLEMVEICEVAGLGFFENRYRDGTPAYYLTEQRVCNDAKGVGPLIMAYAQSIQSKN